MALSDAATGDYEDLVRKLRQDLTDPNLPRNVRWPENLVALMLRANGYCEYCGTDLVSSLEVFWASEADHVIPKDRGGEDDYGLNKAMACNRCNRIKGKSWPDDAPGVEIRDRSARIAAVRPMVLERRRQRRLVEIFARFREVLELRRAQPKEVADEV